MSQRGERRTQFGKPIRSRSEYAGLITTALILTIIFVALAVGAYWLSEKYDLSQQIRLPDAIAQRVPPQTMRYCVPLALAAAVFAMAQGAIATVISRFQRKSEEYDEYGLYKDKKR